MSRSKSLGRERSTTVNGDHYRSPARPINVERAQKLAEVFGVPDNVSSSLSDYPSSQMAGVGLRSVRNRSDDANATPVPRERLASLAYMLDHDRNSLYDLLSSIAAEADTNDNDGDEPRSPVEWPYERPEYARQRTTSSKSSKSSAPTPSAPRPLPNTPARIRPLPEAPSPRPRPDAPSPRPLPGTPSPRPSMTLPPSSKTLAVATTALASPAVETPLSPSRSPVRGPSSRNPTIFRRPSMPSLKRSASNANTFMPPAAWESKSPASTLPTPLDPSPKSSFSASTSNLPLKGSSKDPSAKLRKPPQKEGKEKDKEKDKDKDSSNRHRRATMLARFFGVGYQDLFAAMISFPAASDSQSQPPPPVPAPTNAPPPRPPKSARRSKSMRFHEVPASEAPPLPNNGAVSSRGRDPAVAPLGLVRRGSGMPFADTWRMSDERTSGDSNSSSGMGKSKKTTAITVVQGGNAPWSPNFNDGDEDIMNVLSKLRAL